MTDLGKYGRWAVIAGGSEGTGAEFAKQLAADGFNVVLIARKPGPLQHTARACRAIGAHVRALAVDLLDLTRTPAMALPTREYRCGRALFNPMFRAGSAAGRGIRCAGRWTGRGMDAIRA